MPIGAEPDIRPSFQEGLRFIQVEQQFGTINGDHVFHGQQAPQPQGWPGARRNHKMQAREHGIGHSLHQSHRRRIADV
jgi:hypothetical protein